MARKVHELRILREERSAAEIGAPLLVISQFTLYGDTRKGRRPSWVAAAPGPVAARWSTPWWPSCARAARRCRPASSARDAGRLGERRAVHGSSRGELATPPAGGPTVPDVDLQPGNRAYWHADRSTAALLPIGRFARLSGLTVKALRHYDALGLLSPARTDSATRHRWYSPTSWSRPAGSAGLRELDLPLPAIRPCWPHPTAAASC
jgi:hypothetical protein